MIKLMHTIVVFAHPFDFHEFAEADRTANLVMWRKTMVVSGDDPGTKIVIERETEMHGRKRREEAVRGRKNARSTFSITEFIYLCAKQFHLIIFNDYLPTQIP